MLLKAVTYLPQKKIYIDTVFTQKLQVNFKINNYKETEITTWLNMKIWSRISLKYYFLA